jgi:hypothetical protein
MPGMSGSWGACLHRLHKLDTVVTTSLVVNF